MQQLNINKQQTQHTQCRKVFFLFFCCCVVMTVILLFINYFIYYLLFFSAKMIVCALPSSSKVIRLHAKINNTNVQRNCFDHEVEENLEKTTQV